ncbi:MAG: MGMT family protein [Gammaproteobacteria bacterium]|nr:MGMT family protein [Gammaproteobacteria bacterium]
MKVPPSQQSKPANQQQLLQRLQLYQTIAAIPHGKVASYGQLATLAGQTGAARWVGWCLRHLPKDSCLPWHRVITASGRLAFPVATAGYVRQREKLEQEGVQLQNHKVAMKVYQWQP